MTPLTDLFLAMGVAALAVFFASFLMWMVLPHHRNDWNKLPDEDGVMEDLRARGVSGPGQFSFPHCGTAAAMKDPEFVKRMEGGPSGMLVLMAPGPFHMGRSMVQCVVLNLAIAFLLAYTAAMVLAPGAEFLSVFRLVGTMGILAFCGAVPTQSIWFHQKWSATGKTLLDGAVYGLLMGAIFGWLWPSA